MTKWTNYSQAADLPPHVVERMWRALDRIADGANPALKPGYPDFMNKAEIVATAKAAVPCDSDNPRAE